MTEPLVAMIAAFPGMADRLLVHHVDDGSGHCRACPSGAQRGHHIWPCSINDIVTRARNHAARVVEPRPTKHG